MSVDCNFSGSFDPKMPPHGRPGNLPMFQRGKIRADDLIAGGVFDFGGSRRVDSEVKKPIARGQDECFVGSLLGGELAMGIGDRGSGIGEPLNWLCDLCNFSNKRQRENEPG